MFKTTEPFFDFILRKQNPSILVLPYRLTEPMKPAIIYDGNKKAYFRRDKEEIIILENISSKVLDFFKTSPKIFVIELDKKQNISYKYAVKIITDKNAKYKIEKIFRLSL